MIQEDQPVCQPDPLIDEVRLRRRELFESCENDLDELARRIRECEAQHPEKVGDPRTRSTSR
ncbi:MAG: hypothetical protein ACE5GE_00340 [Phycisphaerae bacterium]